MPPTTPAMLARLTAWADANRAAALDLVRIYLGVGLFVRGVVFLAEPDTYMGLLPGGAESPFATFTVLHYVALAHLGAGLTLALGLLTRLSALIQIPILAAATFLVHLPDGLVSQSFAFSALVLALLVVVAVWGGGPWSLDRAVARWVPRSEAEEAAHAEDVARDLRSRERDLGPAPARAPASGAAEPVETPCTCGHDRGHPLVEPERRYAGVRGLRFLTGTHPRPSAVVYRCRECGGVVEVDEDPDHLEDFRYEHPAEE